MPSHSKPRLLWAIRFFLSIVVAALLLVGCNKSADKSHAEPGLIPGDSFGYIPIRIAKVYRNQTLVDQNPGHADGGDWTFMDCTMTRRPDVKFVVGTRANTVENGDIPVSWGEAILRTEDPRAGALFASVFAEAFQVKLPPAQGTNPPGRIKMQTAVLGRDVGRGPGGGFKGRGNWSATKWFLQNGQEEAELFFNFNVVSGQAEFAEKDQDYREELIAQLVAALRDGPPPERTPENDPTLSSNGPTIVNWKRITGSNSWASFTPDGLRLILREQDEKRVSHFYLAPASRPAEKKLLGAITNSPGFNGAVLTETGVMALVTETIPTRKGVISSTDPQRLWLITENEMKVVPMSPSMTNWYLPDAPLSPDGTFIALQSWRSKPSRTRVIHLYQVRANKWSTIEQPGTVYEFAGWKAAKGKLTAYVRTGMAFRTNEIRKPFLLDPSTGTLSEIATLPPELEDKRAVSPDGRITATVRQKEKLILTDVASGQVREFQFHPSDRKNLYPESVSWVSPRYLFFQGSRPAILDADTLKMSFLFGRDSGFRSVEFTPDFKLALGEKEEGRFLGEVKQPRIE